MGIDLTNLIVNGGAETNNSAWNGYVLDNKGVLNAGSVSRIAATLPSGENVPNWAFSTGAKTQGCTCANPLTPITLIINNTYYFRTLIGLRNGSTAGGVTRCTIADHLSSFTPVKASISTYEFTSGSSTVDISGWVLVDFIFKASKSTFSPRLYFDVSGNMGNNDCYGAWSNTTLIDLTTDFDGVIPPIFAIRYGVNSEGGWWNNIAYDVEMPLPPTLQYTTTHLGLSGKTFTTTIGILQDTGTAPFSYTISGLPLGNGLSINSSGVISGTLNLPEGIYYFNVSVTDSIGYQVGVQLELNVSEAPKIHDTYIPGAVLNQSFSWTPTVTGTDGNLSYSISVSTGSLPTGLSISGGIISGTPTVDNQQCQITIKAINDADPIGDTKIFTLQVVSKPIFNTLSPLPSLTVGVSYSTTINISGQSPITCDLTGGAIPPGMTLTDGYILEGTPTTAGLYSFTIQASNSLGNASALYSVNVYTLPTITTTTLSYARLGGTYSQTLQATGSTPITWNVTSGNLPTGLNLNTTTGVISGTPLTNGIYTFELIATNPAGNSAPKTLSIEVGLSLAITSTSPLPSGTVSTAYSTYTFSIEGIDTANAVAWTVLSGSVPPGMTFGTTGTLAATRGTLSGTPNTAGTYTFTLRATNGTTTADATFIIEIGVPPVITSVSPLYGGINRPWTTVFTATGKAPITWSMVGSPSPTANITIDNDGLVYWLVPSVGSYTFTARAQNEFGAVTKVFTLIITTPSIVDGPNLAMGVVGYAWTHTFTGSGDGPFTWSQPVGTLPPGLILNPTTGKLSGTPTTTGTYNFEIRLDGPGGHAQETFEIIVYTKPVITTISLNSGNVSLAYTQTVQATGSIPLTFAIKTPVSPETGLPPGLSINSTTGIISGTPTTQGTYTFTVQVTNPTGLTYADTKQYTVVIGPSGAPVITTNATLNGIINTAFSINFTATGTTPITWTIASGSLPNGISLSGNTLSGTPTQGGVFTFVVSATNTPGVDTKQFTLTIAVPPTITKSSLQNGKIGDSYSDTLTATGDTPISWSVVTPINPETGLPPGLLLNANTGVISGTPTTPGSYSFTIRATNSTNSHTKSFTIIIASKRGVAINGKIVKGFAINGKIVKGIAWNGEIIYLKD